MKKAQKNYLIYIVMLLLFSGLIYGAIKIGEHFDRFSHTVNGISTDAFQAFKGVLAGNLSHSFAILLIQMLVILIAVRLFGYLFKSIGQPGVIGEIVAGIVLGPSLLGHFYPEFYHFLFRPDSLGNLEQISQLGLVLFMFVIGMEVDFGVLKNKINETLVISHAGILVPFFLGIVASFLVYEEYAAHHTSFLPFALFIGISMSITAFPVLARIIQERNMTKKPVGILAIASAANDDVTAWCLLAVVIAIAKAGTVLSALYTIALTLIYIAVMFLLVRPLLKKIGNVYATKEVINKTFVSSIFLVLVLSATLTEIMGIHALFGAFMAGVVMPPNMGFRKVMMEKVEDVALVFFLPLFFAFTGLRTEIGLINTPELWMVCLMLIAVAIGGKFGGCALAARMVGESWKDSFTIGTLMNTRGLMELVALNIGYEMGVLPPSIFVILVIMALVTTFMTTPLLDLVERISTRSEQVRNTPQRKLILCFGRPESGKKLLQIYQLLFGKQLKEHHLIVAHYTLGTDVNPVNAEQFSEESFLPIEEVAQEEQLTLDKRYRVTDSVIPEITSLVHKEAPEMLLLGAGPRFMTAREMPFASLIPFFGLFQKKVEGIVTHVPCNVAIFVNRKYESGKEIAILIGGEEDAFLLPYLETLLTNEHTSVNLHFFNGGDHAFLQRIHKLHKQHTDRMQLYPLTEISEISFPETDGLLILSYDLCTGIAENEIIFWKLPSFLAIKKGTNFKKAHPEVTE